MDQSKMYHALETCPSPSHRKRLLRDRSISFAKAFLDGKGPETVLKEHFKTIPKITEHGPQKDTLPFLGKTFRGLEGCLDYFAALTRTLAFELSDDTFPGPEGFIVDPEGNVGHDSATIHESGVVCVQGKAKFKSVKTGQNWNEHFMWRLSEFDQSGMIGHWEIWADPLSAYLAVQGELT